VWALRDFRVKPDWEGGNPKPMPPVNQKGLADEFGKPKPAFTAAARMFAEIDPLERTAPASRRSGTQAR
jgi:hypothetical protein